MMKLRTKSSQTPNLSLLPDNDDDDCEQQPSTSSAAKFVHTAGMRRLSTNSNNNNDDHQPQHHTNSPDSPVIGRIAKSNARILNGLDLNDQKRSGGVCVDVFGILPDLKIDELNADKYPNIYKFLGDDATKSLDVETLHLMQHELEEFISLNVDCQKTIHGEITYMSTGEYPTVDLQRRPMPKFELSARERQQQQRKFSINNRSAELTPEELDTITDLGILSSPEDEEAPNILDVPTRFWTWAKEYLRPISNSTVREFKEKLLDRFEGDHYMSRLRCCVRQRHQAVAANVVVPLSPPLKKASHKRRVPMAAAATIGGRQTAASSSSSGQYAAMPPAAKMFKPDNNNKSPESSNMVERCNKSVAAVPTPIVKSVSRSSSSCSNKCTTTPTASSSSAAELRNSAASADHLALTPPSSTTTPAKATTATARTTKQQPHQQNGLIAATVAGGGGVGTKNGTLAGAATPPPAKDEVLAELQRKQQQLKTLFEQTRPVVQQLYSRLRTECAVHEVFNRMDSADILLFQLGAKYERLHLFNSEQRAEAEQALGMHAKCYAMFSNNAGGDGTGGGGGQ